MDPAWIALGGTVFGGVGLKVIEHWLSRTRIKVTDATHIRDELRLTIESQREEIKSLEAAEEKWREQYYDLRDKYASLQTELTLALAEIKRQAEQAQEVAEHLRNEPPPT